MAGFKFKLNMEIEQAFTAF